MDFLLLGVITSAHAHTLRIKHDGWPSCQKKRSRFDKSVRLPMARSLQNFGTPLATRGSDQKIRLSTVKASTQKWQL